MGPPVAKSHSASGAKSRTRQRDVHRPRSVLIEPNEQQLASWRSRLLPFDPLDLRQIVLDSKAADGLTPEKRRARRTAAQIKQVLEVLGLLTKGPVRWERAFYRMTEIFLGVGHVVYSPLRPNTSAVTWDWSSEARFCGMMYRLKGKGLSEREAIGAIVADPDEWRRLPYEQRSRPQYSGRKEQSRRANALRRRWARIKEKWGNVSLEAALNPAEPPTRSPLERKLWQLDIAPLMGLSGGDKRNA